MRMTRLTSAIYEASPPCQDRARVTELRLLQAGLVSPGLAGDTAGKTGHRPCGLRYECRAPDQMSAPLSESEKNTGNSASTWSKQLTFATLPPGCASSPAWA